MVHWSEDQVQAYRQKDIPLPVVKRGLPKRRVMNKLEKRYAEYLELQKIADLIAGWWWEPMKFRIGPNFKTTYCPDFMVEPKDGQIRFDETKGFLRDDAAVKFKVAAQMYPLFGWRMVQWKVGQWQIIMQF